MFKKERVMPKKPNTKKIHPYKNHKRKIINVQRKSKLQIRTGKNLTIKPIDYKGNFKNINI
tara:strand:+ start:143 stop:325 length:183 start_codon:yes stop_codon:yes gene_type:complete